MAFGRVDVATVSESAATTSVVLAKPTGVAEDDIIFALLASNAATDPTTTPSGWTRIGYALIADIWPCELYYKVAGDSEGADYTWEWAASKKRLGICVAYRDGFDAADPIDVVSDTAYATNNATVRAASVTASAPGSPLIFAAACVSSSSKTFTEPADYAEDADTGGTGADFWGTFASRVWVGSGVTGDVDGTVSAALTYKHAFLVVLNPVAGPATTPDLFLDGFWG